MISVNVPRGDTSSHPLLILYIIEKWDLLAFYDNERGHVNLDREILHDFNFLYLASIDGG